MAAAKAMVIPFLYPSFGVEQWRAAHPSGLKKQTSC